MTPLLPTSTESTKTMIAVATPGSTAKAHGLRRAQRTARLDRSRRTTPAPATEVSATVPADSELLRPRGPPVRCSTRSAPATTTPAAPAAVHGTSDSAAPETASSSRRVRPGSSLRGGADMTTPEVATFPRIKLYRFCGRRHLAAHHSRAAPRPGVSDACPSGLVGGTTRPAQIGRAHV